MRREWLLPSLGLSMWVSLILMRKSFLILYLKSSRCTVLTLQPSFLCCFCQAQSVGLLLVLDGQPQRVEWRSVHPRFKHSPVWVSFSFMTRNCHRQWCWLSLWAADWTQYRLNILFSSFFTYHALIWHYGMSIRESVSPWNIDQSTRMECCYLYHRSVSFFSYARSQSASHE